MTCGQDVSRPPAGGVLPWTHGTPRWVLFDPFRRAFKLLAWWMERRRQRRALAWLDDRLLKDVGISRREAEREIAKPFWR